MLEAISVKKAAKIMDVSTDSIRKRIRNGDIRAYKDGSNIRIYTDSIAQYQRSNEIKPKEEIKLIKKKKTKHHQLSMKKLEKMGFSAAVQ
ncbi:MAG: helix-turn-helix domain-containing protein [Alphaproteobacteria bacterium]|nr:helix-turn-helix domain-containing protein [Alphaproteobacteria bacterium]